MTIFSLTEAILRRTNRKRAIVAMLLLLISAIIVTVGAYFLFDWGHSHARQ